MVAKCNLNIHMCLFSAFTIRDTTNFRINYKYLFRGWNLVIYFFNDWRVLIWKTCEEKCWKRSKRVAEMRYTLKCKEKWQLSPSLANGRQFMSYLNIWTSWTRHSDDTGKRFITVNWRENVEAKLLHRHLQRKLLEKVMWRVNVEGTNY